MQVLFSKSSRDQARKSRFEFFLVNTSDLATYIWKISGSVFKVNQTLWNYSTNHLPLKVQCTLSKSCYAHGLGIFLAKIKGFQKSIYKVNKVNLAYNSTATYIHVLERACTHFIQNYFFRNVGVRTCDLIKSLDYKNVDGGSLTRSASFKTFLALKAI